MPAIGNPNAAEPGRQGFASKKYYQRVEQFLQSKSETKGGDFLQKPKARQAELDEDLADLSGITCLYAGN